MLSEKTKESILNWQKKYPCRRSALIPALHIAQAEMGYLPKEVQNELAELFQITPNEVHAVVSFYDMFNEQPVGKHLIHVCKNVSCMLRGSDTVLDSLCQNLCVQPGETTSDGEFTLVLSECLGACDRAPVVHVDTALHGPVNESDLELILEEVKKSSGSVGPDSKQELYCG